MLEENKTSFNPSHKSEATNNKLEIKKLDSDALLRLESGED